MIVRRPLSDRVGVLSGFGAAPSVLGISDWVLYGGLGLLGVGVLAVLTQRRSP